MSTVRLFGCVLAILAIPLTASAKSEATTKEVQTEPAPFPIGATPGEIAALFGPQLGLAEGIDPPPSYLHRYEANGLKVAVHVSYVSDTTQSRLDPVSRANQIRIILDRGIPLSELTRYFPRLLVDGRNSPRNWWIAPPPREGPYGSYNRDAGRLRHLLYAVAFAVPPNETAGGDVRVGYVAYGIDVVDSGNRPIYDVAIVVEDNGQRPSDPFSSARLTFPTPRADAAVAWLIIRPAGTTPKAALPEVRGIPMPWDPWQTTDIPVDAASRH